MAGFEMRCDLLIVGAGPAGCAAAVAAKRAAPSLAVTVIDRATFPREKLCGGALSGGGLRELERAHLLLRVPHALATHAVVRCASRSSRVRLPYPAAIVRRYEFDADLVAQARAAGAVVLEGVTFHGLEGPSAATSRGPIAYRILIAADGVGGASRRALGLPAGKRVPLRETRLRSGGRAELLFELDAELPGYAWRFPCIEEGCAAETGGVFAADREGELAPALSRFLEREGLPGGAVRPGAIRLFDPAGQVGRAEALLVGEALGVDPLAGEGIRYALWSGRIAGRLAARSAAHGRPLSLARYRRELGCSRSGLVLSLSVHLAKRLYGVDERYRRLATNRRVGELFAALVSGAAPLGPLLRLAARFPSLLLTA
jgi:menaquinone-9 beta-reductase